MSTRALTPIELLRQQLWLKKNFDKLTLEDMAEAIEQLRPYIENTMPSQSRAFLRQWNGLLWDNCLRLCSSTVIGFSASLIQLEY